VQSASTIWARIMPGLPRRVLVMQDSAATRTSRPYLSSALCSIATASVSPGLILFAGTG
jgi:hypothetical protein